MSYRNLILTGGINHDFVTASDALARELMKSDIHSEIYSDFSAGLAELEARSYDLITIFALRWRMLDDQKYEPFREEWAYEIKEKDKKTIIKHLNRGGGLLGLHTAAICFDTWNDWSSILGVQWVWNQTFHPPPKRFQVFTSSHKHPATKNIQGFEIKDEIYHYLKTIPETTPLLYTNEGEDNTVQELAWAHTNMKGRVIYSSIAHDEISIAAHGHSKFLRQSALWCIGERLEEH